jgi:hypothetical protein
MSASDMDTGRGQLGDEFEEIREQVSTPLFDVILSLTFVSHSVNRIAIYLLPISRGL